MEKEKVKRITITTESGSKWFNSPEKLTVWINEQKQLYSFFNKENVLSRYGCRQIHQMFNSSWQILQNIVDNELQQFQHEPKRYNIAGEKWANQFQIFLESKKIFTTDSPHTEFILRQSEKRADYGVAAVSVFLNKNLINIDSGILEGIEQAKDYIRGNDEFESDELNKIQDIKNRWDEELNTSRDKLVSEYRNEIDTASELNNKSKNLIKEWQEQTNRQTDELHASRDHFKELFSSTFEDVKTDLERITKTYDDKLALHASVKYWGIQQKQHEAKTIGYGITLGISLLIVVVGLIVFSNSVLDQSIKDIHISRLLSAGILTTFGIWLIKILSNIFMSHMHLATDAQERRTMIHTYLALTRKGQGPKEEDRQLILQTLFRPSASGMVKEDAGPTNLVDMINRLSTKSSN